MGARAVRRYILEKVSTDKLRVYMVWLPINGDDSREVAERAARSIRDSRVVHYWATDLSLADAYKGPLGFDQGPAWDVFLLFDESAVWRQPVPMPHSFMHQSPGLPEARRLDARALAQEVQALLEASNPADETTE